MKVLNIFKALNPSKAVGVDNLSDKFLKDGADILARPISQICNLSIKLNSFPRICKIAKIKPLFKKGSKTDPENYRPILLLPILSKIIERIIHGQTQTFLSKNNILYRFQSGFWKNYSINTCLRHLTEKITTRFEKDLFTGMILTDLQKAFDTIDHQILIKKMKYLDFLKNVIARFKSYLSELSKFKTNISTSYCSPSNLIYDVPQGSILGPLLFLLCINNFIQAIVVTLWKWYLHKNVTEIEKQLLKDFSSLCDGFVDNKLSVHFGHDKTKSILFGTKTSKC